MLLFKLKREQIITITITIILMTITTIIVHTHYSEQNIIRTIHGIPIIPNIIKIKKTPQVGITSLVSDDGGGRLRRRRR